jgi:hypothetical protein
MNTDVLLPANPTDADVCAAAEGIMSDALPCKVLARAAAPTDLATAYERAGLGMAGRHEYTFYKNADESEVLLHLPALGYFTVSVD